MQWWCAAQGVPWTWQWQAYPGVWLFVLLMVAGYRRLRARYPETDRPTFRGWMFGLSMAALWVALDWPVGALGSGYLASLHMVQYLLIALVAPPLLLIGLPRGMYEAVTGGALRPMFRLISHPIPAMIFFVAAMAWTHWPPVVDVLMVSQLGSFFLDLLWLISGIVFWWPVAAPLPERGWMQEPGKVAYLIIATLVNTGVFAYLTFSPLPLYATYELAPPVSGLSTRDDQLVAGLLMKMGGAVVLWTGITILFFRWYRKSEGADLPTKGALGALLLTAVLACSEAPPLDAHRADWLRAGPLDVAGVVVGEPPVPDRAALYMSLRNPGETEVRITDVEVPGARAEFHATSLQDGVMRMSLLEAVVLGPGETLALRPGGVHVMLTALERPPVAGETLTVRLVVDGAAEPVAVSARVVLLEELEAVLDGGV